MSGSMHAIPLVLLKSKNICPCATPLADPSSTSVVSRRNWALAFPSSHDSSPGMVHVARPFLVLILIYQQFSQPWRGILDVGVVVGLSWGLVSLVWFSFQAMAAKSFQYSPEMPQGCKD